MREIDICENEQKIINPNAFNQSRLPKIILFLFVAMELFFTFSWELRFQNRNDLPLHITRLPTNALAWGATYKRK